jgi:AraC-like DNA-binding protein
MDGETLMDVLTDVLESVHVKSLISGRLEFTAPWGLRMPGGLATFYVITRGACSLELDGQEKPISLSGGDFVLLPNAPPHVIRDSLATPPLPKAEVFESCRRSGGCQPGGILRYGGGGALTTIIGGVFQIENPHRSPLLSALPSIIHIAGDGGNTIHWFESTLQFVASEMASGQPGAETIVGRLADILLVQALRAHLVQSGDHATGWLRALIDPKIGRALSLIHQQPERPWTVEALAFECGMSRSAFAARFTEFVLEPPLSYLTRWRMTKASRLLRSSTDSIGQVAGRVGYEAEAAFSKAFKRWNGLAPGTYRRTQNGEPAARRSAS